MLFLVLSWCSSSCLPSCISGWDHFDAIVLDKKVPGLWIDVFRKTKETPSFGFFATFLGVLVDLWGIFVWNLAMLLVFPGFGCLNLQLFCDWFFSILSVLSQMESLVNETNHTWVVLYLLFYFLIPFEIDYPTQLIAVLLDPEGPFGLPKGFLSKPLGQFNCHCKPTPKDSFPAKLTEISLKRLHNPPKRLHNPPTRDLNPPRGAFWRLCF